MPGATIARPPIAHERLKLSDCGQVVYELKTPYSDGTTHVVMSPLEWMQRLAALVPRPPPAPDSLPRRPRAECEVAIAGGAQAQGARQRRIA
jgi:hypothetical protein